MPIFAASCVRLGCRVPRRKVGIIEWLALRVRAALVRDAGRLALRGQRDARSNSEVFCSLAQIVVVPNNYAV